MDCTPLLIDTLDEDWKKKLAGLAVGVACIAGNTGCHIIQGSPKSWMQRARAHDAQIRKQNRKKTKKLDKAQDKPVAKSKKPEEWPHPSKVAPGVPRPKFQEERTPLLLDRILETRTYFDPRIGAHRRKGRASSNKSRRSLTRGFAYRTGDRWKPQKLMSFIRNPNSRRALDQQRHGFRKNPGRRRRQR